MTEVVDEVRTRRPVRPLRKARLTQVSAVADSFVGLMRSWQRARARLLAAAEHDVEWSGHVVLKVLENEGPMRAGTLADTLHADASTVSRQVAALVKDGLVERQADPGDGRASLLVVTDKARTVLAQHDDIRVQYFADMLTDWTDEDLGAFAGYLERFTDVYDSAYLTLADRLPGRHPEHRTDLESDH